MSIWIESTHQPLPPKGLSRLEDGNKTTFFIDPSCKSKLAKLIGSDSIDSAAGLTSKGFCEYINVSYTEQHQEDFDIKSVLSDTFVVYAMGAQPVRVSMDGFLQVLRAKDDRLDFIALYMKYFRGTVIQDTGLVLMFAVRNTLMRLIITDIRIDTVSDISDFVRTQISGIGYRYLIPRLGYGSTIK